MFSMKKGILEVNLKKCHTQKEKINLMYDLLESTMVILVKIFNDSIIEYKNLDRTGLTEEEISDLSEKIFVNNVKSYFLLERLELLHGVVCKGAELEDNFSAKCKY